MKRLLFALAAVCAVSCGAVHARESVQKQFESFEAAWNEAHLNGNIDALAEIWADDIALFIPGMTPLTKNDALSMWRNVPVTFTKYESRGLHVRRIGRAAVVTGRIERARDFGGQAAEENWYFTKVYERRNGRWKVILFHASPTVE